MIKIKKEITSTFTKEITVNKKTMYNFSWHNILPENYNLISERLYFDLNLNIDYQYNKNNNKIILMGQYNEKFWFFKIIKDAHKYSYKFSAKKPLLENIDSLKISILDWYNIIKHIDVNQLEVEYAVAPEE